MKPKFSFIDLFAGIGGFRLALTNLGGECIGFSEIAPDAIDAYCTNYKEDRSLNLGDITKLKSIPSSGILTAGVPCQSWSIAGRKLGFDDSRGQLWNDALYLLNESKPKAFIFENVKGLADPRNEKALQYIMQQIEEAGYHANYHLLNSYDYGVPQSRVRIYIIGFKDKKFADRFELPHTSHSNTMLAQILETGVTAENVVSSRSGRQSLSVNNQGFNDYFLFNDLRNGDTTVHSWDIIETTTVEKELCLSLLLNRRKSKYGILDGNPLSINHLMELDPRFTIDVVNSLLDKGILKEENYLFRIIQRDLISEEYLPLFPKKVNNSFSIDELKLSRYAKVNKIKVTALISQMCEDNIVECVERRYDFKNTKISTGLNGINRIFLPTSRVYPTLVASDTNDFFTDIHISANSAEEYKRKFLDEVYFPGNYRRITKEEACAIQGFPRDFELPTSRARWMKLIGNSVAVKMIQQLAEQIIATGVFNEEDYVPSLSKRKNEIQLSLFD